MSAPRILPVHEVLETAPELVHGLDLDDILVGGGTSAFAVVSSGDFGGRWFERGDVVVCVQGARPGEAVVLVAHTRGRPRLGHQRGAGFTGDRGEPCSAERWAAAGAVRALWRRSDGQRWQVSELEGLADLPPSPGAFVAVVRRAAALRPRVAAQSLASAVPSVAAADQLSLFCPTSRAA